MAAGFAENLSSPYLQTMFGAQQTGKSALLQALLTPATVIIDLAAPRSGDGIWPTPEAFVANCRSLPADRKGRLPCAAQLAQAPGATRRASAAKAGFTNVV